MINKQHWSFGVCAAWPQKMPLWDLEPAKESCCRVVNLRAKRQHLNMLACNSWEFTIGSTWDRMRYPLVIQHSYGKWPIYSWFSHKKMVIFHSYASLPVGLINGENSPSQSMLGTFPELPRLSLWVTWLGAKGGVRSLLVGGFNTPEKYESQLGWLFPIYGKIKTVPNHQPDYCQITWRFHSSRKTLAAAWL